jgi:hypothetical protein
MICYAMATTKRVLPAQCRAVRYSAGEMHTSMTSLLLGPYHLFCQIRILKIARPFLHILHYCIGRSKFGTSPNIKAYISHFPFPCRPHASHRPELNPPALRLAFTSHSPSHVFQFPPNRILHGRCEVESAGCRAVALRRAGLGKCPSY